MRVDPPVSKDLPTWLPESVARYVAHTEHGLSIRELARRDGCHASTVLRQIRKLETMRDDPMIDAALEQFRATQLAHKGRTAASLALSRANVPGEVALMREARRILARLCETGAVLAVADGMENAVVVRDMPDGETLRTATVTQEIAQAMALKDWIQSAGTGKVRRYSITAAGRSALSHIMAEEANVAQGFAEAQQGFVAEGRAPDAQRSGRFAAAESPLVALARRKDRDGALFLDTGMVAAGERLREDFELAQMGTARTKQWAVFLQAAGCAAYDGGGSDAAEAARKRVSDALCGLGDGLADVALRCCCYLEGLETIEKRLGWSARSAKVVLRIALGRLRDHYDARAGGSGDYIG
ncbi:DUF6456 domain-containing protein [Shimia haliotis]|uniref:DUF6456 domain-containing protein n=1 Tax=Shimia haliotis TaxID=1280847 RepID=A0A1I4B7T9_9RHOB|nr:DUF6456 domain-containing protein [Shimia haliotis]SFK64187.1 hypothetical protein SAMN04488036_101833 [Shimia haliotis]